MIHGRNRIVAVYVLLSAMTIVLFGAILSVGAVDIPVGDVIAALFGNLDPYSTESIIIKQSRLPMALAALLSGASLSCAGLMLQTTFRNPLAGPSILGVSSGASLGVAVIMLGGVALGMDAYSAGGSVVAVIGALAGAFAVIAMLIAFSSTLRNSVMLLIVGVMVSYLTSSVISMLNYLAPSEDVKSFVVWGLGSFAGVRTGQLLFMSVPLLLALVGALSMAKPLDALLLGERYAATMGYSVRRLNTLLLIVSGLLTAVVTAFCGPIGFIGLVVPHIARMLTATSRHSVLMPATMLSGCAVTLLCTLFTVIPSSAGVIPINVVTPFVGVPIIFYIILNRRKLNYFN